MTDPALAIEALQLRNAIYGEHSTHNWVNCSENWIADIEWLRANAPKEP